MEYLLGAIIMLITLSAVRKYIDQKATKYPIKRLSISQSRSFDVTRFFSITLPNMSKKINTQSTRHFDRTHLRVVILEEKAYWILDNTLFVADIIDGDIDKNSTKVVDTMALDKVELDKMVLVVDQLTGGNSNDSGYPRNSQF